jgi:alcohol dehydrogenase YqhD (iron-dependent ADH family)
MENFEYCSPVKVLFGKGKFDKLALEILPYSKRILFVYGEKYLKRSGTYDRVVKMLQDAGIEWVEHGGLRPNPRLDFVQKGIELCRKENLGFVLGVGGGSVSDASKAIAAGAKANYDIFNAFIDFHKIMHGSTDIKYLPNDALPVGVVITKSGTGSEFDLTSVITRWETHEKLICMSPVFYPRFAICDPTLIYSLPADQTAYGIADMMTHYFEQYFSPSQDTEFLDRFKEAALQTIIQCGPHAVEDPTNYVARSDIAYCGLLSCSALNITGVTSEWASHFIEHEITAITDLNHGMGMAIIYPGWMRYVIRDNPAKFAQFAERVWGIERKGGSDLDVGMEGIEKMRGFWTSLGIPKTLSEAGVDTSILPTAAKQAVRFGSLGAMKALGEKDVLAILKSVS